MYMCTDTANKVLHNTLCMQGTHLQYRLSGFEPHPGQLFFPWKRVVLGVVVWFALALPDHVDDTR